MKVLLSPKEYNHIKLALEELTTYYEMAHAAGSNIVPIENLNLTIYTMQSILKDYENMKDQVIA